MAFGVSANPNSFALPVGAVQDVTFTFVDVPGDETGTETIAVGSQQVVVTLTFLGQNPESVGFTVPADVTRELLSSNDTEAVIRYTRT